MSQPEDVVNERWLARHGIVIPRAAGYYESTAAWVKVDNAGRITHAGLRDQTILSCLISCEAIDKSASYYAFMYLDWKTAYFSRIEAARHNHEGNGAPTAWTKEDRYSKLMLAVPRKYMRYVEIMTAANPLTRERNAAQEDPLGFSQAFAILCDAMDAINKQADDAKETHCASYRDALG